MRDAAVPEPPPHKCSGKRNPGKGRLLERASPVLGNLVAARAVAAGTTGASAFAMAARLGDELFRGFGAAGRAYRIFVAENKFFKFMTAARATVFKHGHDASPVNVFSQAWA